VPGVAETLSWVVLMIAVLRTRNPPDSRRFISTEVLASVS